jgi:hypothetical protein
VVSASTKSAAAEPGKTVNTNKKNNSDNKQQQLQQHKHGAHLLETLQKNQRKHAIYLFFKEENLPQNLRFYTNTQALLPPAKSREKKGKNSSGKAPNAAGFAAS